MHLSTKKAARHGRQVHRSVSGAPNYLRCTEVSQVHRSFNGVSKATRMVGAVGLEPTIPKAEDFKSPAYANSATPPCASKCTTPRRRRARTEPLRESAEPPRMRTARSTEQQLNPDTFLTLGTPPRQSGFMGQKTRPINPPKLRKKLLNLALPFVSIGIHAGVAELADAYGSGPYGGNPVKVQVLSPAP